MSRFRVGQGVTTSTGGVGVIVDVQHTLPEPTYQVFLDGRPQPFYEGQLSAAELKTSPELANADAVRCRLAALSLTNPSGDSALSVNEGRIDHIPYQYRPLLRLLRADRTRLLIADEVGVGKTIEAGLILRELHARRELRRVLVVCSKALIVEEKWQQEMRRFDEEFVPLDGAALRHCLKQTDLDGEWPERYARAILPFSLFNEEFVLGEANGPRRVKGLLELSPSPTFDLLIVDERTMRAIRSPGCIGDCACSVAKRNRFSF
jgi:ATP-dependent helicase HepA